MFWRNLIKHPSLAKKNILGLEKKPCITCDKQHFGSGKSVGGIDYFSSTTLHRLLKTSSNWLWIFLILPVFELSSQKAISCCPNPHHLQGRKSNKSSLVSRSPSRRKKKPTKKRLITIHPQITSIFMHLVLS